MTTLFVCSQARIRSFTARNLCILGGLDAECAGTDSSAKIPLTDNLLRVADRVFCFEKHHKDKVLKYQHADESKVHVIGLEDIYNPYDDELVVLLIRRLQGLGAEDVAQAVFRGKALK